MKVYRVSADLVAYWHLSTDQLGITSQDTFETFIYRGKIVCIKTYVGYKFTVIVDISSIH